MTFAPARLDLTARALTGAFFCALSLAVLLALSGPRPLIGLAAAMAGVAVGCALLAPRAYVIEDGGLTVRRVIGALRVEGRCASRRSSRGNCSARACSAPAGCWATRACTAPKAGDTPLP